MEVLIHEWRKRCLAEHLNNGRKHLKSMNQIITLSTGISFSALNEFLLLFKGTAPLTWLIYGLSLPPGTLWQSQDSGTCRVFLKCTSVSARDRKEICIISHLFYQLCVEQVLWKVSSALRKTGKSIQVWKLTLPELFKAQNCKLKRTGKEWVLALSAKKILLLFVTDICFLGLLLVCFLSFKSTQESWTQFILKPTFPSAKLSCAQCQGYFLTASPEIPL